MVGDVVGRGKEGAVVGASSTAVVVVVVVVLVVVRVAFVGRTKGELRSTEDARLLLLSLVVPNNSSSPIVRPTPTMATEPRTTKIAVNNKTNWSQVGTRRKNAQQQQQPVGGGGAFSSVELGGSFSMVVPSRSVTSMVEGCWDGEDISIIIICSASSVSCLDPAVIASALEASVVVGTEARILKSGCG